MEVETTLAETMGTAGEKAGYDAACKRLLSEKSILAWIMKSCLTEYQDWSDPELLERPPQRAGPQYTFLRYP